MDSEPTARAECRRSSRRRKRPTYDVEESDGESDQNSADADPCWVPTSEAEDEVLSEVPVGEEKQGKGLGVGSPQRRIRKSSRAKSAKKMKSSNKDLKPYACNQCDYKTTGPSSLTRHMSIHTGDKPFACSECTYRTADGSNLLKHMRVHTGEKPYVCDECDYKCADATGFKIHKRSHTGEKPYACTLCDYKASSSGSIRIHMIVHTGDKRFTCDVCGVKSNSSSALALHMRTHTGERPFACDHCNYKAADNTTLRRHVRTHTGEKPYSCEVCDYKAGDQELIKVHMRNHTGEKPFACDLCNFTAKQSCNLRIHKRTHTGEKPYGCKLCDYRSITSSALKDHVMSNHTGEKPFACDVCGATFSIMTPVFSSCLMFCSVGEKPFACDVCGARYIRSYSVKLHKMSAHAGAKPFACDKCDVTFTRSYSLKIHKMNVHSGLSREGGKEVHQASHMKSHETLTVTEDFRDPRLFPEVVEANAPLHPDAPPTRTATGQLISLGLDQVESVPKKIHQRSQPDASPIRTKIRQSSQLGIRKVVAIHKALEDHWLGPYEISHPAAPAIRTETGQLISSKVAGVSVEPSKQSQAAVEAASLEVAKARRKVREEHNKDCQQAGPTASLTGPVDQVQPYEPSQLSALPVRTAQLTSPEVPEIGVLLSLVGQPAVSITLTGEPADLRLTSGVAEVKAEPYDPTEEDEPPTRTDQLMPPEYMEVKSEPWEPYQQVEAYACPIKPENQLMCEVAEIKVEPCEPSQPPASPIGTEVCQSSQLGIQPLLEDCWLSSELVGQNLEPYEISKQAAPPIRTETGQLIPLKVEELEVGSCEEYLLPLATAPPIEPEDQPGDVAEIKVEPHEPSQPPTPPIGTEVCKSTQLGVQPLPTITDALDDYCMSSELAGHNLEPCEVSQPDASPIGTEIGQLILLKSEDLKVESCEEYLLPLATAPPIEPEDQPGDVAEIKVEPHEPSQPLTPPIGTEVCKSTQLGVQPLPTITDALDDYCMSSELAGHNLEPCEVSQPDAPPIGTEIGQLILLKSEDLKVESCEEYLLPLATAPPIEPEDQPGDVAEIKVESYELSQEGAPLLERPFCMTSFVPSASVVPSRHSVIKHTNQAGNVS